MYAYYLLSVCKPFGFKPSITIKNYIKRLQIVGFWLIEANFNLLRWFSFKSPFFLFSDSILHFGCTFRTRVRDTRSRLWLFEDFIVFGLGTKFDFHLHRFLSAHIWPEKSKAKSSMIQHLAPNSFLFKQTFNWQRRIKFSFAFVWDHFIFSSSWISKLKSKNIIQNQVPKKEKTEKKIKAKTGCNTCAQQLIGYTLKLKLCWGNGETVWHSVIGTLTLESYIQKNISTALHWCQVIRQQSTDRRQNHPSAYTRPALWILTRKGCFVPQMYLNRNLLKVYKEGETNSLQVTVVMTKFTCITGSYHSDRSEHHEIRDNFFYDLKISKTRIH